MAAASSPGRRSGTLALLSLGGVTATIWISLLLADSLPWASTARAPSSLRAPSAGPTAAPRYQHEPMVANLAQAPSPLGARPKTLLHSKRPVSSTITPLPPQRLESAKPEALDKRASPQATAKAAEAEAAAPAPAGQHTLPGSLLLGGPLNLASLQEKPMVPAARIEQALRARSGDRLSAVPPQWRPTMEALIQGQEKVLPTEVVHLPAPHLKKREDCPIAVRSDGVAIPPLTLSELSRQALERWAKRQSLPPPGSVRPVMVVLEPLSAEPRPGGRSADG